MDERDLLHADHLEQFLKRHALDRTRCWIVGISAGSDSSALIDAFFLLHQRQSPYLTQAGVVLAHYDHGWRSESADEARFLRSYSAKLATLWPHHFELERSSLPKLPSQNLEAVAREQRYTFFQRLARRYDTCYLFLAHHSDDLCETVFKNLLEGKELPFLCGMREWGVLGSLEVFRPWLELSKQQLLDWVEQRRLIYFEDRSNRDLRFLRARMREQLFPTLDASWPKAWRKGILQVARYSEQLANEMVDELGCDSWHPQKALGGWRWQLPSTSKLSLLRYFLRRASSRIEPLDREGAERLAMAISHKRRCWQFSGKHYTWWLGTSHLVALHRPTLSASWPEPWHQPLERVDLPARWGPWQISRCPAASKRPSVEQLSSGEFVLTAAPTGRWTRIGLISDTQLRSRVLRRMQREGISAYLRPWLPLDAADPVQLWPDPATGSHGLLWRFELTGESSMPELQR